MLKWSIYALYLIALINIYPFLKTIGMSWELHHPGPALVNIRFFTGILMIIAAISLQSSKKKGKYFAVASFMFVFLMYIRWHVLSIQQMEDHVKTFADNSKEVFGPYFGVLSNARHWDLFVLFFCILFFIIVLRNVIHFHSKSHSPLAK
jgi:hypothetical protein